MKEAKEFHISDNGRDISVMFLNLPDATEEEANNYVDFVKSEVTTPLKSIEVKLCDDGKVDVGYLAQGEKFERIRRITGYLTGNLNTWNNAKKAEERERVKHGVV